MVKQPTLSILILTIEGRESLLERLLNEFGRQIKKYGLSDDIEILISKDKSGEHKIGWKRNLLLSYCNGLWEQFWDDDDMPCEDYLLLAITSLKTNTPDVLALEGIMTTDGVNPRFFHNSLSHLEWFEKNSIFYRPPNHLNPIRSAIAKSFKFQEINEGEDKQWSMDVAKSQVLKTESSIGKPYYFYNYASKKES